VLSHEGDTVTLGGADMIQGTPIIAIIPASSFSSLSTSHFRNPAWTSVTETKINISLASFVTINSACEEGSSAELLSLIRSVLRQDPRSHHSRLKHVNPVYEVELTLNSGNAYWLVYSHGSDLDVNVHFVTSSRIVNDHRGRTELWLKRLYEKVPQLRIVEPS